MARYQVTVRTTRTEIIDAENEYMAAVIAAERNGPGTEIADVRPAGAGLKAVAADGTPAKKTRRPVSPEARARLAQNLVKARAARAAKAKARKKAAAKSSSKRTAKAG